MVENDITPKYDSTLGLIFRLNNLWSEVDIPAKTGKYEGWNNVLDRLYNNLAYRGEIKVVKDKENNILSMVINDSDNEEYKFLSKQVNLCRQRCLNAKGYTKGILNKRIARSQWYKALNAKDIWLRKFMHKLNLYIKETKKDSGAVMFGGR